jgi:hypothetical protein
MTDTRRGFLAKAPLAALAVGVAGCSSREEERTFEGSLPDYAAWLYDPTPLLSVDNRLYATFDVARLYEHRDLLPEGLFSVFDWVDGHLDAVDIRALGNVTTTAYTEFDRGRWSTTPESGLTLVADGRFDGAAIAAELDALDDVTDAGTHAGYRLHTRRFDWDLGSLGDHTAALTVATGPDALVLGVTFDVDEAPERAATLALDARRGEADTVADAHGDAEALLGELGETTFGVGVDVRTDYLDNFVADDREDLDAVAADVVGLGLDLDFEGAALRGDTLVVFADADAAADADVESLVTDPDQTKLRDADLTRDGRVVRVKSSVDAGELWESYWPGVDLGAESGE